MNLYKIKYEGDEHGGVAIIRGYTDIVLIKAETAEEAVAKVEKDTEGFELLDIDFIEKLKT